MPSRLAAAAHRIRRHVEGDPLNQRSAEPPSSGGGAPLAEHLLRNGAVVLAAAGALLYGAIALAYDRFYRVLGIAPSDVDITQTDIVARTATVLGLLIAVVAATYSAFYIVFAVALPQRDTAAIALGSGAVAVPVGAALLSVNSPVLFDDSLKYTLTVCAVLTAATLLTLAARPVFRRRRQRRPLLAAIWLVALGVAYVNIVNGTVARAAELAEQVYAGKPIPPRGQTFMYDVHADPVCASATRGSDRTPRYGLYLGESRDWIAIYDPAAKTTSRQWRRNVRLELIPQESWEGEFGTKSPTGTEKPSRCPALEA
jgi:hypothetical protein